MKALLMIGLQKKRKIRIVHWEKASLSDDICWHANLTGTHGTKFRKRAQMNRNLPTWKFIWKKLELSFPRPYENEARRFLSPWRQGNVFYYVTNCIICFPHRNRKFMLSMMGHISRTDFWEYLEVLSVNFKIKLNMISTFGSISPAKREGEGVSFVPKFFSNNQKLFFTYGNN